MNILTPPIPHENGLKVHVFYFYKANLCKFKKEKFIQKAHICGPKIKEGTGMSMNNLNEIFK